MSTVDEVDRCSAAPRDAAPDGARRAPAGDDQRGHGPGLAHGRRRDAPRAASGCARCSCSSAAERGDERRSCARRRRSSWCTWRRWSTTTSSTPRRCAAAARPCSRAAAAATATATGDFLFSRAFALLAANGDERAGARRCRTRASRSRAASWRSATTPTGVDVDEERYLLRCELKTASLFAAACRLGALAPAAARPSRRRARGVRPRGRARVPDARRRARRQRPGRAHRQAARHRPARRDGHAAADPRARVRPGAGGSTCATSGRAQQAEAVCDRIAATGALEETRERAASWSPRRSSRSTAWTTTWTRRWRTSPTASPRATRDQA